jgi:hypothetical protein
MIAPSELKIGDKLTSTIKVKNPLVYIVRNTGMGTIILDFMQGDKRIMTTCLSFSDACWGYLEYT